MIELVVQGQSVVRHAPVIASIFNSLLIELELISSSYPSLWFTVQPQIDSQRVQSGLISGLSVSLCIPKSIFQRVNKMDSLIKPSDQDQIHKISLIIQYMIFDMA